LGRVGHLLPVLFLSAIFRLTDFNVPDFPAVDFIID